MPVLRQTAWTNTGPNLRTRGGATPVGGTTSVGGLSLIHYYKMDEASGSRVDQLGGASWTVETGAPPGAAGKLNNGASVSVANNLVISTANLLAPVFTMAFWTRVITVNNGATNSAMIGASDATAGFDLAFPQLTNDLVFTIWPSGATLTFPSIDLSATQHAIIIGAGGGQMFFRIDARTKLQRTTGSFVATGNNERLGWNSGTAVAHVADEMAVWNRFLTDSEIDTWHNGGAGKFYPL